MFYTSLHVLQAHRTSHKEYIDTLCRGKNFKVKFLDLNSNSKNRKLLKAFLNQQYKIEYHEENKLGDDRYYKKEIDFTEIGLELPIIVINSIIIGGLS